MYPTSAHTHAYVRTLICHQSISNAYVYIFFNLFFLQLLRWKPHTYILVLYYFHIEEYDAKSQECKPIEYKEKNRIRWNIILTQRMQEMGHPCQTKYRPMQLISRERRKKRSILGVSYKYLRRKTKGNHSQVQVLIINSNWPAEIKW